MSKKDKSGNIFFVVYPDLSKTPFFLGYIDPGTSSFIFSSAIPTIIGFVVATMGSFFLFFKRRLFIILLLLLGLAIAIIFIITKIKPSMESKKINTKVVILGLDGLDPNILSEGIKKNILPNFKKLQDSGYYSKLDTVMPPQSPVAWASFITAANPAKHGVYDFIERDPSNYQLDLTFSNPKKNTLKATPFWEITSKNHIPATILFLPDTFPPSNFLGQMLSGMGVPDIQGTLGSFTLFTTKEFNLDPKFRGKQVKVDNSDSIKTEIEGPKYAFFKEVKVVKIPLTIVKDGNNKKITIKVQNNSFDLSEKEFSDWIRLEFKIDFFTKISGIAKFYLKQISPEFELYLSSINLDPDASASPISYPKTYAKDLSSRYGMYSTLGLPHDTWALEEDIFDEDAFINQAQSILSERKKIYIGELERFKSGIFFGYFGITDTMSHMYWRYLDNPKSKYQNTIFDYYQKVDEIVGETLKRLGKTDTLIVLSDHGFAGFDYEINMNTWLKDNGYLSLTGGKTEGGELLEDVDWNKTRAYSIGYNGIYLNRKDREREGIVSERQAEKLQNELVTKLLAIRNPFTNTSVIKKVYTSQELSVVKDDLNAPDLMLGYHKGIRSSWDTAVGATPKTIVNKRTSKWSGDHLFDPTEVPGIIFANKKLNFTNPSIIDVIPVVLSFFNIPSPK